MIRLIKSDHPLTNTILKNLAYSFFLKIGNGLISYVLVPLTLLCLDNEGFGIWSTISSFVIWIYLIDLGLANSFRNKFTQAMSDNNSDLAKKILSTTYILVSCLTIILIAVYLLMMPFLNWNSILNVSDQSYLRLNYIIFLVILFVCIRFITSIINTLLLAIQKVSLVSVNEFLGSLITLVGVYFLKDKSVKINSELNLLYISTIYTVAPLVVMLITSFWLFKTKLKHITPSFSCFDPKLIKELLAPGLKFFVIQITMIFVFSIGNFLVARIFSVADVTEFAVVNKYFNVVMIFFSLIILPFWSGFTESYAKNDIIWIVKTLKKLVLVWIGFTLFTILLYLMAKPVIAWWTNDKVASNNSLLMAASAFVIIQSWIYIFTHFLNGVGKINIQIILLVISASLIVPLTYLGSSIIGISGILWASNLVLLPMAIILPLQTRNILLKKGNAIWHK